MMGVRSSQSQLDSVKSTREAVVSQCIARVCDDHIYLQGVQLAPPAYNVEEVLGCWYKKKEARAGSETVLAC